MMRSVAIIDPLNCFATKDESFFCKHYKSCYEGLYGYGLELCNQSVSAVTTSDGRIKDIREKFSAAANCVGTRLILEEGPEEIEPLTAGTPRSQIFGERFPVKIDGAVQFDQSAFLNREMINATFYTARVTASMGFLKTIIHEFTRFIEEQFNVKLVVKSPPFDNIEPERAICLSSAEVLKRSISGIAGISAGRQRYNLYWKPKRVT